MTYKIFIKRIVILSFLLSVILMFLNSCVSIKTYSAEISRNLTGRALKSPKSLSAFFMAQRPDADRNMVLRLAGYYVEEGKFEGINSDIAFAQMCLETGYLRFGNLVSADMHNYCGLGAIDINNRGEVFATEREGVRAHIQHLHAYATTADISLNGTLIDRRYKWVIPRGKASTIFELAGTWAADRQYGDKLDTILSKMSTY